MTGFLASTAGGGLGRLAAVAASDTFSNAAILLLMSLGARSPPSLSDMAICATGAWFELADTVCSMKYAMQCNAI